MIIPHLLKNLQQNRSLQTQLKKKNPIFQSETNEKTEHLQPRTSRKARNPGTYGTWRRNRESSLWTTRREGSSRTTRQAHATEESSLEKLMSTPPTYLRVSDPWGSSVGEEGNFHGKSSCAISFFFSWSCSLKKEVKTEKWQDKTAEGMLSIAHTKNWLCF